MAPLGYWTLYEACIAVICACMPDSRFFFSRLLPKTLGWGTTTEDPLKSPYQLTDMSARSARTKAMRAKTSGMISVTTEFELKSAHAPPNAESTEHLTEVLPDLERAERGTDPRERSIDTSSEDGEWPMRPAAAKVL